MRANRDRHIIVLRFSALGDVAIAPPLLKFYATRNPSVQYTMVSRPILEPLFEGVPNLNFFKVDFKKRHKGIKGLYRLFKDLMKLEPTGVADIHSVLRSHILKLFFFFTKVEFSSIKKGRKERRELTRKKNKKIFEMEPVVRRYEKVLISLGQEDLRYFENVPEIRRRDGAVDRKKITIGVAPFAAHRGKTWPIEKMERVVSVLADSGRFEILLFGGGAKEIEVLEEWEKKYKGVKSLAGKGDIKEEFRAIERTALMVTMDSANMHFASCLNVPVISIWGATHPYLGFYGLGQDPQMAIQGKVECRPCSPFGKKECFRGDYACFEEISPELVLDKILNFFDLEL